MDFYHTFYLPYYCNIRYVVLSFDEIKTLLLLIIIIIIILLFWSALYTVNDNINGFFVCCRFWTTLYRYVWD